MSVPNPYNHPYFYFPRSLNSEFSCSYDHAILVPIEQIKKNSHALSQTLTQSSTSSASSASSVKKPFIYQLVFVSKNSFITVFNQCIRILYLGPVSLKAWQEKINSAISYSEILAIGLSLNKETDIITKMLKCIRENENVNPNAIAWLEAQTVKNCSELELCFLNKRYLLIPKTEPNPNIPQNNTGQKNPLALLTKSTMLSHQSSTSAYASTCASISTSTLVFSSLTRSNSAQVMSLFSGATMGSIQTKP